MSCVVITFREMAGKTLMTIVQSGFVSEELRDFVANTAWIGAIDRLNDYFTAKGVR